MDMVEHYRGCVAEYGGPADIRVWFMFDNHTFHKIEGDAQKMRAELMECLEEDHWHGYVTTRIGKSSLIEPMTFHGNGNRESMTKRVDQWISDFEKLFT